MIVLDLPICDIQKIEVLDNKLPSTSNGVESIPNAKIGSLFPLAKLRNKSHAELSAMYFGYLIIRASFFVATIVVDEVNHLVVSSITLFDVGDMAPVLDSIADR